MASMTSTRVWRITKAAGRPFPKVSDDDVTDYMVMEAVTLKVQHEDQKAEEEVERKKWKSDTDHLKSKV